MPWAASFRTRCRYNIIRHREQTLRAMASKKATNMGVSTEWQPSQTEPNTGTDPRSAQTKLLRRSVGTSAARSQKPSSISQIGQGRRGKPEPLKQIDNATKHLERTLKRHKKAVPLSLRNQLVGLLHYWFSQRSRGETSIYPGISKMAVWAEAGERQTQKNLRTLTAWRVVVPLAHEKGGKGKGGARSRSPSVERGSSS